jgi:CheY-like chemotaxis protein
LLSNAIKYNRAGGGVAVRVLQRGTEVQLVVQDTGLGLTAQQQTQLFQPYNRLGAESGTVQGSGVGLSIARGLMALMGGRLEARSNPGVGSEFSLWLTQASAPTVLQSEPARSDFGALEENHHTRGTVLYVEDNEVNVLVFQACLARRPQVQLHVARTAAAALELARQQAVDLVVLDLNLPDCTGLELATQLRHLSNIGNVPMVLFTADAAPQIESQARAAGFTRVWHKPFDTVRLLTDIDSLLEPVLA